MQFHAQVLAPTDELATLLRQQLRDLDFDSPGHLMETLTHHITTNRLPLSVISVAGKIMVTRPGKGIVLRFNPL